MERKKDEERHRQPFEAAQQRGERRVALRINALEKPGAENAVINDRPGEKRIHPHLRIDVAVPDGRAGRAEILEMLVAQHRLGLAVAGLLAEVGADLEPAVMPDHGGGAEADHVAALHQPPADIDVVARLAVFGIEAADLVQRPFVIGHVAARHVLGNRVGQQHVAGRAGRRADRRLNPVGRGRRNIRAAHRGEIGGEQRVDQEVEPVAVGHAVRIGEGDDLALRRGDADVARGAEALVDLHDVPHAREILHDFLRVVLRAVVDEDRPRNSG